MCSGGGEGGEGGKDAHTKRKTKPTKKPQSSPAPRNKQERTLQKTIIKDESSTAGCQKALLQMCFLIS